MRISDWSSDVCSSDLLAVVRLGIPDRFQQVENEPRIIEDLVVDGPVIGRALQQESRSGIFQDDLPRTAEITDRDSVARALDGADAAVNCVSQIGRAHV